MGRITTSRIFLWLLLLFLIVLSVFERIKIGGDLLSQTWWVLILFPLLHISLHATYLLKIHYIKIKHLGIILLSHFSYFLFFIFQCDTQNHSIKIILPEVVKAYSPAFSIWLYHIIISYAVAILCATLICFVMAEILFAIRIRQYIRTEAVVVPKT